MHKSLPTHITLSPLDRDLLIRDVKQGATSTQVGFEDAERTFGQLVETLGSSLRVQVPVLASALWSSNLLDEIEEWRHPKGLSFDKWLEQMLPRGLVFDRFWNTIDIEVQE